MKRSTLNKSTIGAQSEEPSGFHAPLPLSSTGEKGLPRFRHVRAPLPPFNHLHWSEAKPWPRTEPRAAGSSGQDTGV